ncbi:unnamed protein product [Rhizoctonia solani]|uniref:Uncharacterized protein n=1 Tax=Rhizoctonia solani TaxID=456999 RepID=A0A8H2WE58_9AGAM|nr:unnamed protein product [Rhizoctonia solani]
MGIYCPLRSVLDFKNPQVWALMKRSAVVPQTSRRTVAFGCFRIMLMKIGVHNQCTDSNRSHRLLLIPSYPTVNTSHSDYIMSSFFSYAYTVPFPKDSKISRAQAFEALRHKARAPMDFVPITSCEVLEENPKYIKRKVALKNGQTMTEDIDLYAPSLVTFKGDSGSFITNLISENAEGERFLTFTFFMPLPGIEPASDAEVEKKKEMHEMSKGAVTQTLKVTLKMFEEGKLH